ncbi:leucine rich repeat domain-containing protein, partial [Hygrophoropsis aurantiaca]
MERESGDDYLRRVASFIRNNEKGLAEAGFVRRRRPQRRHTITPTTSVFNPVAWFSYDPANQPASPPPKPVIFSIDTHRLFYILMRLEAAGMDIGTLDVRVDNPSKPMTYVNIFSSSDKSDTLSLASFRSSLSAVSGLSLGVGWLGRQEPQSIDAELKYIYSSFTKVPALSIKAPGPKVIAELADDSPNENALPLDAFKNLQSLECSDIDPRTLLGWDKVAESVRSLTIKRSGLEDISDIFIGAVRDDQARRDGKISDLRARRIIRREASFHSTRLPESVPEDAEDAVVDESPEPPRSLSPLPPYKWAFLKVLSLADNSLTFLPSDPLPYLTSVTHLDLSSNLLVSVPPGLAELHNLVSLNLADNMIDSVLGIYTHMGQVLSLNLSRNRLDSICGLERLMALERVDLRQNHIEESAEVGRLATLPNIADVWIEGNPLGEIEDNYRVACFEYFWKEGKNVSLDGSLPGFYERKSLPVSQSEQIASTRPLATLPSPPVVPVGAARTNTTLAPPGTSPLEAPPTPQLSPSSSSPGSQNASPMLAASVAGKAKKRRVKRIVDLGDSGHYSDTPVHREGSHLRPGARTHTRAMSSFASSSDLPPSSSEAPFVDVQPNPSSIRASRPLSPAGKPTPRRTRTSMPVEAEPNESEPASQSRIKDVELYRARIEALRSDMGDGWLKVYSQSQNQTGVA